MTDPMPTSTPTSQGQSASNDNQSLRWSLQNFPVPLQVQVIINLTIYKFCQLLYAMYVNICFLWSR